MHKELESITVKVNKIIDYFYLFLFWVCTVFCISVILQVLYYIIRGKNCA